MGAIFDLVIRRGLVVDGSGSPETQVADVAIVGDRIVAVGKVSGAGRDEIDANGSLVTPGFVDVHTHFDGQVTWASQLTPSSLHGATTVVGGNCGVGFAPCRPKDRDLLIRVMEGVEDIPEPILAKGLQWDWESFPEYLNAIARRRFDIDFATQIPHGPVRIFAMGQRGADREPATRDDLDVMTAIVQDALRAGALGFSTSRTMLHRLKDGKLAPTITAGEDELLAIAHAMRDVGLGVLQGVDDFNDPEASFGLWPQLARESQRPVSLALNARNTADDLWQRRLEQMEAVTASGAASLRGQVICRPIGMLLGLDLSFNPFSLCASWTKIEPLPLDQKLARLRTPEIRARLLSEPLDQGHRALAGILRRFDQMYVLGNPPNYEPSADSSLSAQAHRDGKHPLDHAYDMLLNRDGREILYFPVNNFPGNSFDAINTMLRNPATIIGIGDGGAHQGMICDSSTTTFLLTYWTRDRKGDRLPLPTAIRMLTHDTSAALGLEDRGMVAPGYKADINVIDYDRLHLHAPFVVRDLPAGGRRLMQRADGYVATIKSGQIIYREGEFTGALPGRLVRGAQPCPN
jgi:N-acyl-D-aspartate/D-glutamate deacylase